MSRYLSVIFFVFFLLVVGGIAYFSTLNKVSSPKLEEAIFVKPITKKNTIKLSAIHWEGGNGLEMKASEANCLPLVELPVEGEHFVTDTLALAKGTYSFVFETKPTNTELYVYMIGDKTHILFPWVTQNAWPQFSNSNLKPISSQVEHFAGVEKLTLVVESVVDQTIQLRWQHGHAGATGYKGSDETRSQICKAQFGRVEVGAG